MGTETVMQVHVNSEPTELALETSLAALLERLGLDRSGVAVAVNAQVVPRTQHGARVLVAGDQVEVLRAVGGG
jgi:sulfur carrier protein